MRWPRVRFTMGQLMVLIADVALMLAAAANLDRHSPIVAALPWLLVLLIFGAAAACGFWASRRPWVAVTLILIPAFVWPLVDHHDPTLAFLGCLAAIGGGVGWVVGIWQR